MTDMTRREFLTASAAVVAVSTIAEALPLATVKGLTFDEALDQLHKSHRYIQRTGWDQKHLACRFFGDLLVFDKRDRFMVSSLEELTEQDEAAVDWRLIERGELDVKGDFQNMTYAEAGMWLAGNNGYIQRAGWGTQHVAHVDTGVTSDGRPISILELRNCYQESKKWEMCDYPVDVASQDWRTMSIQETQPRVSPDWMHADWNYRSHIHGLPYVVL